MISLLIHCQAETNGKVPSTNGYRLLSALSHAMASSERPNIFHDTANKLKDFILSPLLPERCWKDRLACPAADELKVVRQEEYAFRICFLDDEKALFFRDFFLGTRFNLASVDFKATESVEESHFFRRDSKESLLALPAADGTELLLLTPTGIKSAKSAASLLLPRPEDIFGNLVYRWKEHFGQALDAELNYDAVSVVEFRLISRCARLKENSPLRGCVGTVRYSWKKLSCKQRSVLTALSLFAFYVGVGYKTTQGLGQIVPKLYYSKNIY